MLQTRRLTILLQTLDEVRAMIDALEPSAKAEVSADWLRKLHAATSPDPWIHGFALVHRERDIVIGQCGFKGSPTPDGVVEIAYGISPAHQGNGYATEAANALVAYAFGSGLVRLVLAHTLPEPNASTRVLAKCGFRNVGEVVDPDDGVVWRWEKLNEASDDVPTGVEATVLSGPTP